MRYRFIREQHAWHRVVTLCRVMQVSRSGYYGWLKRKPCARAREDARLLRKVRVLHYRFKERYGAQRLCRELRREGEDCSRHRVARLKRQEALWTKRYRRFVLTTQADPAHVRHPNRLARSFSSAAPDRVWVGDVTSVWTLEGWLYVAILLDLYSRRVVGWSMAPHCRVELTVAALQMALDERDPCPGLLHHSDRGVHYSSAAYQRLLRAAGIEASISRTANCLDNAVAESFFSTLKNELTLHQRFATRAGARAAIYEFIELYYNRVRQHSYLHGLSPMEFETAGLR
jgi:putative transposase